ncbi:hypothetical protein HYV50_03020 [Candidatus Pacearchaeota archaeon]|nr:hypothetical protein [Candidatus Pacearchaeota archaeon]
MEDEKISLEEFKKLDLRVGRILDLKEHPNAEKLYVLKVDFGSEERTIVAGLRKCYSISELKGKQAVFVFNLEPAMLRGIKSDGMILAASNENKSEVVFIEPEKEIGEGSKIS